MAISRSQRTVALSIDFDFFVKEKLEYDWGHRETGLFINSIWPIRAMQLIAQGIDPFKEVSVIGEPSDLAGDLTDLGWRFNKKMSLSVAESHASAYYALKDYDNLEIVNIDAHHDISYGQNKELNCGNWIRQLCIEGRVKNVTIIYPEWRKQEDHDYPSEETLTDMKKLGVEVSIGYGFNAFPGKKVDSVFIARSGAWVPPWTDNKFMEFLSTWMFRSSKCQIYGYEFIDQFKRSFNYDEVRQGAERLKQDLEEMKKQHPDKIIL